MVFVIDAPGYDLGKTLQCGQVFRYQRIREGWFHVNASGYSCTVTRLGDMLQIEDPQAKNDSFWRDYFATDWNMAGLERMMKGNRILEAAFKYSQGIHLLRQDPFECLISFIISQQKRIPQIQEAVESLCRLCGPELPDGSYGFPRPGQIAMTDLSKLRLGYREKYVYNAAEQVASGAFDLYSLQYGNATYQDAMHKLQNLYGVGAKVASCVALFGLGFTNAFPIDTHIQKVLDLPEMRGFRQEDYGEYVGYVQQYLFNWALYNGY